MADTATPRKRLSVAEFLEWEQRQKDKFELFDGIPQAMAGGSRNHNVIAVNIVAGLLQSSGASPAASSYPT